ncbi:heterokaryon incompatibility protein-domain-containing protein [Cladorrhinum sp. PSN332]|nr:heterokaryon incompatibility protein-domain-containing protein [Cladorrhinum sp. PSN332]
MRKAQLGRNTCQSWIRLVTSRTISTFGYSPLRPGEIRLVRLEHNASLDQGSHHPASDGTPIRCTITHHPLSSPPPYTALSYCWGEGSRKGLPPLHISMLDHTGGPLQQGTVQIRNNLYQFLRRVRPIPNAADGAFGVFSHSWVGYLWIDALCIDQGDLEEKAVQVPLMRQIYSSARRIVMWLGPGSQAADRAMSLYERWQLGDEPLNPYLAQGLSRQDCHDLDHLERNRYWTRSWVYPEASTPRVYRELWCGEKIVWFNKVAKVNNFIRDHILKGKGEASRPLPQPNPFVTAISKLNILTQKRANSDRSMTLSDLLVMTYRLRASIEVDKIYALLSVYNDIQGLDEHAIRIDYSLPPEKVHRALAKHVVEKEASLDILLLCSAAKASSKEQWSWVPNFGQLRLERPYDLRTQFDAGGFKSSPTDNRPHFRVDSEKGALTVTGVRVDTVTKVHPCMVRPLHRLENMNWENKEFWGPLVGRWMHSLGNFLSPLQGPPGGSENGRYVDGGAVSSAADWVLSLGVSSDLTMTRDSFIRHWPLFEAGLPSVPTKTLSWGKQIVQSDGFPYLMHRMRNRAMFWTKLGYLGAGDADVAEGDVVVVLPGLAIPVVLRAVRVDHNKGPTDDRTHWRVIGPCFVKGIMDGEGLQLGNRAEFVLV